MSNEIKLQTILELLDEVKAELDRTESSAEKMQRVLQDTLDKPKTLNPESESK